YAHPGQTQTVFALGFGSRLVDDTSWCDYPAEALLLRNVGRSIEASVQAMVVQRPDLGIGLGDCSHPGQTKELELLGIRVVLISVTSLDEILNSFRSIARLLGNPQAGERLAQKVTRQLEAVKQRAAPAPRRSTLLAVGVRPLVAVG